MGAGIFGECFYKRKIFGSRKSGVSFLLEESSKAVLSLVLVSLARNGWDGQRSTGQGSGAGKSLESGSSRMVDVRFHIVGIQSSLVDH